MEEQELKIKNYLTKLHVKFITHKHSAVYTCEEAKKVCGNILGIHSKNILIKGKKTGLFWLVIVPEDKRLDIKYLEKKFNDKISFASNDDLKNVLGIETGAVSPFTLINNKNVILVLDKEILESAIVSFHPNINTETLELSREDFKKYLDSLDNKIEII